MANNTVAITLTIDEANALKAWTNQQAAVEKLKQKLAALKAPDNPLGSVQAGAMKALSTLGQVTVAITGIGSVIAGVLAFANQLKAEYQNLKQAQQNAASTNIDYAKELASAVRSTGGRIGGAEMDRLASQAVKTTGQAPAVVTAAFNAVFTAIGPQNKKEDLEAIKTAENVLQQYPEQDAQTIRQLSAVTAQNKRVFGLTDQEALGYQQKAQNASFVKDVAAFSANVAGKLSAVALSGDFTPAEAGSLTGTLSQVGGDFEGSTSTMAALTLGNELKERLPHIKSGKERLNYMQDHPELQKAYLEGGKFPGTAKAFPAADTGRTIYKPHVLNLFDKNSQTARDFEKNVAAYGDKESWGKEAAFIRKQVNTSPSIQVSTAQRQGDASNKQLQLRDADGAMAAVSRKIIEDLVKSAGATDIAQKISTMSFEYDSALGTQNPLDAVNKQLQSRIGSLRQVSETKTFASMAGASNPVELRKSQAQIESDAEKAAILEDARNKLLTISEDFEKSKVLRKAEPVFNDVRQVRDALKDGATPKDTDKILQDADRKVRKLASESQATSATAGNELVKIMTELANEIRELREVVKVDVKAVDENTKSLPKPGTTPTPRPPNVSSLQNKRS